MERIHPTRPPRWGWQFEAACPDADSSLFFAPNYFEKREEKDAREAKARVFCRRCSVREECLSYALETNQEAGVWGGYAEDDRRRLRKRWLAERRRRAS